ncbi:MAG: NAD-dependent epimerase/dehydratase family protein [Bacteroidetes bacterium]|nr:NAD-dependent epimerase/dehydratase family protein [Bacteroidota bacterium]
MPRNNIIQEDLEFITGSDLPWSVFEGKTVLIAGANGFLPAYMVETLLYLNEKVHTPRTKVIALVRNIEKARARFKYYQQREDLQFLVQDVCTPLEIIDRIDYIIHAASQASPKYFGRDPVGTLTANILGTRNLLDLAKDRNAAGFLFFSSGEVYGTVDPSQIPINEKNYGYVDPTEVRSCYAESKRMGETMCVSWAHQYRVPAKIVRPFHTYGPGMALDDGRVFADFVADIVNDRNIVMKSDGSAVRPFCYLADAVAGFFTVLLKGQVSEAYNIGNDKGEISILDLAELLVSTFPEKKLKVVRQERLTGNDYLKSPIARNCPNISKIGKLGWKPTTSAKEGFRRTVRSFL